MIHDVEFSAEIEIKEATVDVGVCIKFCTNHFGQREVEDICVMAGKIDITNKLTDDQVEYLVEQYGWDM